MKKENRLLKNYQFKKLIVKGKYLSNSDFFIYYLYRDDQEPIRVGISVPKKRVKKAFARNRIKRQIKHMLINIEKQWSIDLVIIIKKNYLLNNFNDNKTSLLSLLNKIAMKEKMLKNEI